MATKNAKTTKTVTPAPATRKITKPKVEAPMIVKQKVAPPAPPAQSKVQQPPTHEQIARRAFEIYARRGYTDGNHTQDWLQAERELRK